MANVSSSNGIEKQPKLRFPNFTEPYKLMEFSKYADVNPKCGKVPNSFYYIDLECVNAGEIKDLRIEMAETAPSRAQRVLTLYDILFQTVRPYQKNNYHFKAENDLPTVASTGYAVFRTEQSSEYLYELIHTERFLSDIMKRCTGTSFPAVSSSDIEDIAIWTPEFQEQKKIGDFLTLVDTKIAKQRLLIEHLKKYKRGVISKLLNGTLAFDSCSDMELKRVGDFCEVQMCKRIFKEQTTPIGEVPFYKIGTIGGKPDAYITRTLYDEYRKKYSFPRKGEFLISCAGTVGKCVLYNGEDSYYQDSNIVWLRNNSEEVTNEYLYMLVSNVDWSTLNSTTITRIYNDNLRDLSFYIPPVSTQKKITSFIFSLMRRIDFEQEMLEGFLQEKAGLLQQLFI